MPYMFRVDEEYPGLGKDQTTITIPIRVPPDSAARQIEAVRVNTQLQHEAQQAWNHHEQSAYDENGKERWWTETSYNEAKREPIANMFKTKPQPRKKNTNPEPRKEVSRPNSRKEVTDSVPPKAGSEKIPADVIKLAKYMNSLPKNPRAGMPGYPSYNTMRHDPKLDEDVIKKTGRLSQGSRLRKWIGDERLFSKGMWQYLTDHD